MLDGSHRGSSPKRNSGRQILTDCYAQAMDQPDGLLQPRTQTQVCFYYCASPSASSPSTVRSQPVAAGVSAKRKTCTHKPAVTSRLAGVPAT